MSINVYGTASTVTMKRSTQDMKYPHKTSIPFGKLVPIGGAPIEVLPGDTPRLQLSSVIRMMTPKAPLMDDISADFYSMFIPNRLVWSKAKAFFGENDAVAWTLPQDVEFPTLTLRIPLAKLITTVEADFNAGKVAFLVTVDSDSKVTSILASAFAGTLFDYFGFPFVYPSVDQLNTMIAQATADGTYLQIELNALPFRCVQLVYNEYFRNENVVDPILALQYDDVDINLDLADLWDDDDIKKLFRLPMSARWKDLFTSCMPAPQRGPSVGLPFLQNAPVITANVDNTSAYGSNPKKLAWLNMATMNNVSVNSYLATDDNGYTHASSTGTDMSTSLNALPKNLIADLSNVAMATINQIRTAFCTQRYYEKLSRTGARYFEYTKAFFGVRPLDSTIQRPQYLGGKHVHINVAQVLSQSKTSEGDLGQTGAYSATGFSDHLFTNSFAEHGFIINFVVIRKEHTYCQGMDKLWTKREVWDIYNPTFAHIGEVPVMKNEIYWQPGNEDVFGYNEAWYEYRTHRSLATGLLSPLHPNSLSYYTLTDVLDSAPTLSDEFIEEDAGGLDQALVASASVTDQFICDFYFDYKMARVMPVRSIPGLIDHY